LAYSVATQVGFSKPSCKHRHTACGELRSEHEH
jgi:hypothetical protein